MKKSLLCLFLFAAFNCSAQWVQRASFPGTPRAKAASFTINDKVYVVGGVTNNSVILHDVWEYDILSDTWSQKPAFPGPERYGATAFVINGMGYVATGGNDFGYLDDLWMYNPSTGTWTQKQALPVGSAQHENQRREAFSFSIGNKGYLGGGDGFVFGANGTSNYAFFDLWEYNPANNTWTTKASLPDFLGRNMSVGAAVNGKGYVGLGCDVWQSTNHTSFWEYDPVMDMWTARANFPTSFTTDASVVAMDSSLYIVGGLNINTITLSSQVVKFNPSTNSWTVLPSFNGGAIAGEVTGTSSASAFIGGGYNASIMTRNDWWEYSIASSMTEINATGSNVVIYPNPAKSVVNILVNDNIEDLQLYSSRGEKIQIAADGFNTIQIADLPSGIYLLKLRTNKNEIVERSFIKID